jgi:hypothetical protein
MPFGFQIAPDTLPSGTRATGSRSALAVSGFRLRARLGFSIPPCFPGQRGITPAFGYGAPHPSAEGTSTPLTHALPSTHYEGATTSHLRIGGRLFCSLPPPTCFSWFVFAAALRVGRSLPPGPGCLGAGGPQFRLFHVDANGISQVSRRSILCLCSAPRPRSNRSALAMSATSVLPPLL